MNAAQAGHRAKPDSRAKLLVIFNCQAEGLATCLEIAGDIRVDGYTHIDFEKRKTAILARLDRYQLVIVAPFVEKYCGIKFPQSDKIMRVPVFNFGGYHPDHCNLSVPGGPLKGNFSMLSFAAFRLGIPLARAMDCFNAGMYTQMGYFDFWETSRKGFIACFKKAGFDLSRDFVEWSRHGPAAYIPAHPKIACLRDMARRILEKRGLPSHETDFLPQDNLARGANFPVYPEIGSRVGVQGSYLFKAPDSYRMLQLDEFVTESYAFFRDTPGLEASPPFARRYDHAFRVLSRMR